MQLLMKAILDPGLRGPGIIWRDIKLTGEEKGFAGWAGRINPSRGLTMVRRDSGSVLMGKKEGGFLPLLKEARWDFFLDDKPVAVANVKEGHRYGFMIGSIFCPFNIDDYARMSVIEGDGWRLDRGVMNSPDIGIEAGSMETILAVSGIAAVYEAVLWSSG